MIAELCEAPFFRKIGNPSSRENLVVTSAYERVTKRTASVQTLGVEEGRLVVRLTGDLRNAIFSQRESEKKLVCICNVDKRSGTLILRLGKSLSEAQHERERHRARINSRKSGEDSERASAAQGNKGGLNTEECRELNRVRARETR